MARTRIAPSPTGYPHIGTIYQALFDFAFAKKYNGQFIIRIEDTDRTRFVVDAEEKIFSAIDWFGLEEDESPRKNGPFAPYRQSERLEIYQKYAKELVDKGKAYYCFCTPERLDEMRKKLLQEKKQVMYDKRCRILSKEEVDKKLAKRLPHVIRMKIPENQKITVIDEIRGEIVFDSNAVDDQVLLKSDGFPTYHLAVVIDDHLMGITHMVRAEEWIPSSPKHFLLYEYFGWERPLFFHTSLLRNPDKSKLSKRQGHTNVSWYREEGFLPEAILNFLALLGWSHPEEKEIFSLTEFISLVELKDMKAVAPTFDLTKLKWLNQQYVQNLENDTLIEKLRRFYHGDKEVSDVLKNEETLGLLIDLAKTRMETLKDFRELVISTKAVLETDLEKKVARDLLEGLSKIDEKGWTKEAIFAVCKEVMKANGVRMPVLYKIFTGKEKGLPLPESLEMLNKEKTLKSLSV